MSIIEDRTQKYSSNLSKILKNMNRGLSAGEQKLAEKLIILNERGKGMLTRIYNIKKVSLSNYNCLCRRMRYIIATFNCYFITLDVDVNKY